MPRILTDNLKLKQRFPDFLYLPISKIASVDGDSAIEIAVGSRALANGILGLRLPKLRFFQLTSAGFDDVRISEYNRRGILISNAANIYSVGMAEFVVFEMLKSAKRYNSSIKDDRIRILRDYKYITELARKNVMLLGVGGIGGEIAKRLSAFDMNIYGYARSTKEKLYFKEIVNDRAELKELLRICDYVVSSLPYNVQTNGFINAEIFECMKKNATFVNVGRRKVINEHDMYAFLKENKSITAILDMFERFPNPLTNRFRRLSNVLVLPGVTAISNEIDDKLADLVRANIAAVYDGARPINVIY